jgi:hypothetical protein
MDEAENSYIASSGRRLVARDSRKHPKSPDCPPHLRRICGTCSAFTAGAAITAKRQHCAALSITVDGLRRADACNRWSRKIATPMKP